MSNCLWSTELYYHKWSLWVQTSCSSSTWCCFFLSVGSIIRLYSVHSQFYSSKVPHTQAFSAPRADLVEVQCKVKRCCKTWASCFNIYSRAMQFTHTSIASYFFPQCLFPQSEMLWFICAMCLNLKVGFHCEHTKWYTTTLVINYHETSFFHRCINVSMQLTSTIPQKCYLMTNTN